MDLARPFICYRVRNYNPEIGRFITEDPIGFKGKDTNLQRYVLNNPILFKDEFGFEANQSTEGGLFGDGGFFNTDIDPNKQSSCQKKLTKEGTEKLLDAIMKEKDVPEKLLNRCIGQLDAYGHFKGKCTRLKVFEDALKKVAEKRRKRKQCIFKARRYCPKCSISHCQ